MLSQFTQLFARGNLTSVAHTAVAQRPGIKRELKCNRQFFTVNVSADLSVTGKLSGTTGVELTKAGSGKLLGDDTAESSRPQQENVLF